MENQQTVKSSSKLLDALEYIGVIGAIIVIMPYLINPGKGIELPVDTISACGNLLYTIPLIAFTWLTANKVKKEGLTKPSATILMIFIITSILSIISEFFTDSFNDEFTFWDCITIVDGIMLLVTAIAFFGNTDTKPIGIWMIIALVCGIIVLCIADSSNTAKWVGIIEAIIYVAPVAKMFASYKTYLSADSDK